MHGLGFSRKDPFPILEGVFSADTHFAPRLQPKKPLSGREGFFRLTKGVFSADELAWLLKSVWREWTWLFKCVPLNPSTPGLIKSIGLECTDWDCVRFIGLEFARTPYPKMHGVANTIDSVKNARARIVQGSWDSGLCARCN